MSVSRRLQYLYVCRHHIETQTQLTILTNHSCTRVFNHHATLSKAAFAALFERMLASKIGRTHRHDGTINPSKAHRANGQTKLRIAQNVIASTASIGATLAFVAKKSSFFQSLLSLPPCWKAAFLLIGGANALPDDVEEYINRESTYVYVRPWLLCKWCAWCGSGDYETCQSNCDVGQ